MALRSGRPEDAAALTALWRAAGLHFRAEYVGGELQSALTHNSDLVIVAEGLPAGSAPGSLAGSPGGLAGSVFGTFDGRRGWLNRLATSPDRRGEGVATTLVRELERRLLVKGCVKINLLVEPENADVVPFYERLGFHPRSMTFMDKWIADPPDLSTAPAPLSQPAASAQPSRPSPSAWSDIEPALHIEPYVFVTVCEPPPDVQPFAAIREDEGLTLVLTRDQADRAALPYEYVAARITVTIGSSLSAVGLTAEVSRVLADAGISCNVIAAFRHDHLFVDWARGPDAAALLQRL